MGRFLFGPRRDVTYADSEAARRGEHIFSDKPNRERLVNTCTSTGMRFLQIPLLTRDRRKRTHYTRFYKRGSPRIPSHSIDYTAYLDIDLTLISERSAQMVEIIRSRSIVQVGSRTHLIQQGDFAFLASPYLGGEKRRATAFRDRLGKTLCSKDKL